ncbi:NusG domain II-containing protein [Lactobacillus acetotolerans]|uniref:NusG domain II-containing protein n=1 Tax=Lactobacillus acetotolerans TaxID=1600 RepID=UPI0014522C82|nr:NusG domain II-containing protein [Lactobacillus acetotolerans]QJD72638.1 NusG domain II-containing protein [Lactobacillus acetotolerans]
MKILKQLKFADFIIIALLILVSFIPYYFIKSGSSQKTQSKDMIAVVKVNNKEIKKMDLSKNQTWKYDRDNKINVVQIKNKRIRVSDANCKDQVCVKEGWKSQVGQTIVCLPHKFLIELKSKGKSNGSSKKSFDHTLVNP